MKTFLVTAIMIMACSIAFAQQTQMDSAKKGAMTVRICTPSREQALLQSDPLILVTWKNKLYQLKNKEGLNSIDPNTIESLDVVKDKSLALYGEKARYGAIVITLNDSKFPDVFKAIKNQVVPFKKPRA